MGAPFTFPVAAATPFDGTETVDGVAVVPPFVSENVRDGIIEARETAPGTAARFPVSFGYKGAASNKFIEFFQSIPSDGVGFILADDALVRGLSVAVKNNTTATFTVYNNGVAIDTLSLATSRINSETDLSIPVLINDEISVKITSGSARDIIFNVFMQVDL
jgi:hypothetical protein